MNVLRMLQLMEYIRINVRTITKINDLKIHVLNQLKYIHQTVKNLGSNKEIISCPGETNVTLNILNNNILHQYKLNEKRKIDKILFLSSKVQVLL